VVVAGEPQPFTKLAKTLRSHLDGVLAWIKMRVTNGALEDMDNKIKVISHRAYGYRTTWTYIANIYTSALQTFGPHAASDRAVR
jgi:transposase